MRWVRWCAPTNSASTDAFLSYGEGQRVEQVVSSGGTTTTTTYIGAVEEIATSGPATTTTAYYGPALSVNSSLSYTLSDGLGSVSEAVSLSGSVSATQLYAPYGAMRYQSGTLPGTRGYTGQHADAATGLDYYGARYYDPLAGQFTSADTTLAGGLNRYAYVRGNPETRTDPSGHNPISPARDYNSRIAYQQWLAQPVHVYFGDVGTFLADTGQFFLGTDTLKQSYHTLFQDAHASAADRWRAAGVGIMTLGIDALTIGAPEVGEEARAGEVAWLAADEVEHAAGEVTAAASEATTEAAAAAANDSIDFAHGTSLEHAQSIVDGGLNADAARAASKGGLYSEPGSFFTFNVNKYGKDALQEAYYLGKRQAEDPVILMGKLPQSIFDELVAGGGVDVRPAAGLAFPETVFSPQTFAQLNVSIEWNILDPYGRV